MKSWKTSAELSAMSEKILGALWSRRIDAETARAMGAEVGRMGRLMRDEISVMKMCGVKPAAGQLLAIKRSK